MMAIHCCKHLGTESMTWKDFSATWYFSSIIHVWGSPWLYFSVFAGFWGLFLKKISTAYNRPSLSNGPHSPTPSVTATMGPNPIDSSGSFAIDFNTSRIRPINNTVCNLKPYLQSWGKKIVFWKCVTLTSSAFGFRNDQQKIPVVHGKGTFSVRAVASLYPAINAKRKEK